MMLLARRLGYVQLIEAVRFTAQWERDASLRPRTGDVSALDDYYEHGRICGAGSEQAMDDAVRRYVARYLAGRDKLLMARSDPLPRAVTPHPGRPDPPRTGRRQPRRHPGRLGTGIGG